MRRLAILLLAALPLVGGVAAAKPVACPAGLRPAVSAELYFENDADREGAVSEAGWRAFVDQEVTPRFPYGLATSDVYGRGETGGGFAREPSKALFLVLNGTAVERRSLNAVRAAYAQRFGQGSVLRLEQKACVSF
jgi:hypothetical protein